MNDERRLRALLDAAVADLHPRSGDPVGDVLARASGQHRRGRVLLAVAACLVLLLGTGTVAVLYRTGGPLAPTAGQGSTVLAFVGQDPNGSEWALAGGSVSVLDDLQVAPPPGWDVVPSTDAPLDRSDSYDCAPDGRVVYRATIQPAGSPAMQCIGVATGSWLWETTWVRPNASARLQQQVLPDGTVQWLITLPPDAEGAPTTALAYPAAALLVVGRGVGVDELGTAVDVPAATLPRTLTVPAGEALDGAVKADNRATRRLDAAETQQLTAAVAGIIGGVPACSPVDRTVQFTLVDARGVGQFYRLGEVDGCATLTSDVGGVQAVPADFVAVVTDLAG